MSDKSFGDHMSRGIVKNPLLSTAVIGLSIEDLTQNAVLLPVSRSRELFGGQEPENTLADTPSPAGDATSNPTPTFTPIHPPQPPKKDDFDVNEYFARLQGTRYVSAPINSHIEDGDAIEKEENLEEINLNEPNEDIQQTTLTADIAQNFSQLPTVLPQVASAVFSSFSNMLSMKSREHTPEVRETAQGVGVPLMGVSEREVAPPPREPPVTAGPGNFRLTTKKKYAQIPGLSSGEPTQMPTYTPPPLNQKIFTAPQQEYKNNFTNVETNIPTFDVGQNNANFNVFSNTQSIPIDTTDNKRLETPKLETTVTTPQIHQESNQQAIIPPPPMFSNLAKRDDSLPNVGKTILPPSVARRIGSNKPTLSNESPAFAAVGNIFVPTPVEDTQSLPTASQSFIPGFQANPSMATSFPINASQQSSQPLSTVMPPTNTVSSAIAPPSASLASPLSSEIGTSMSIPPTNSSTALPSSKTGNLPPPPRNAGDPSSTTLRANMPLTTPSAISVAPPPMFPERTLNIPTPSNIPLFTNVASVPTTSSVVTTPSQSNICLQDQPAALQTEVSAQDQSQPTAETVNNHVSILSKNISDEQMRQMFNMPPVAEPAKIPQPPKASGNTNFRMTRKRPQYYSGPIEGVGAISNNIKPTLTPVAPTVFQGAVFTPEADTGYEAAVFTPQVTEDVSSSHSAILTPENITEHQKQFNMFSPVDIDVNNQYGSDSVCATYNTSFDLSRQPTNSYEPPKQETGFGIIGSLKSKLSSIDINKIQNSVTTFFDPAYKTEKPETTERNQPTYDQNQGIEIFVPNPETHPQPYNYDAHETSFTYGQGAIPNASDYYNQQAHNMYSTNSFYSQPSYGTQNYSHTDIQVPQTSEQHSTYITSPTSAVDTTASQKSNMVPCEPSTSTSYLNDNVKENKTGSSFAFDQKLNESFGSIDGDSDQASNMAFYQGQLDGNKPKIINMQNIEGPMNSLQIGDDSEEANLQQSNIFSGFQGQREHGAPDATDAQKEKIIEDAIKNLQGPNPMTRAEIKAKAQEWNWTEEQIALNFLSSPFVNQFGELSEKTFRGTSFVDMLDHSKEDEELMRENRTQLDRIYSAPLHDLSSMIANRANEISDRVSEGEVSWNSNEDEVDDQSAAERLRTLGDTESVSVSDDEDPGMYERGQTEDLNICETCREVNSPEEKDSEEDLTHQLIKNITAPIQLSNAVEVPLTETHSNVPDDFDTVNQCAEILLIADETIETLHIQSATELLDDNKTPNSEINYGWRTEAPLPPGQDLLDHDYSFETNPNPTGFFGNNKLFFDNLPDYASEMKIESTLPPRKPTIKPIVLEREISIPTAPPAEDLDDAKSDETGILDVQSIEQDASKDFPVFEEYVIEPSKMENNQFESKDKIDKVKDIKHKNDDVRDTFTNRVDRFKKLEGTDDATEQKDTNASNSNSMMPSYFDTGNYAVDAHFKNSLTSPTIARIPPGFEDFELASRGLDKQYETRKTPDTSTQTHITTTISNVHTRTENLTSTVFSSISTFSKEPAYPREPNVESKLRDFASTFGAKIELKDTNVRVEKPVQKPTNTPPINPLVIENKSQENKTVTLPDPINFFTSSTQITDTAEGIHRLPSHKPMEIPTNNPQVEVENKTQENKIVTLPDPTNFFASSTQEPDTSEGSTRLASYKRMEIPTSNPQVKVKDKSHEKKTVTLPDPTNFFASSTQETDTTEGSNRLASCKSIEIPTENSQIKVEDKSQENKPVTLPDPIHFFGSSTQGTDTTEGVNRLASYFASPAKTDNTKSFFELSQGQDHYRQKEETKENKTFFELNQNQDHYNENISNIPHDRYIANLNLMKDLTSLQNIEPDKDQVVRTVNYFTIEHDSDSLNFNKGEPSLNLKQPDVVNKETEQVEETIHNHDNPTEVVNKCKYCRDLKAGPVLTIRETNFDSIGKTKFRQAMDTTSGPKQEVSMQPERETERPVNVRLEDIASDGDNSEGVAMLTENRPTNEYEPVKYHWFYRVDCEEKSTWRGFSNSDSRAIEDAFQSPTLNESTLVPTDGGRFDVNVLGRLRTAVYWSDKPTNVRRCSWFYKGTTDARYVPYTEAVAEKLEEEYRHGMRTGEWHRRLVLPNKELVVMHGPAVMVHFLQAGGADAFSAPNLFTFGKRVYRNPPKFKVSDDLPPKIDHLLLLVHGAGEWKHQKEKIQSTMRPRVVRRGIDESEIEDTEPSSIDHLLLLCHGVGSACDMRFRAVEEVVDDFRSTSLQLLQSHYRNSYENGIVGRVEVLPISWHASLHAGPAGVDRRLARVTLASIPRLRNFTNDTVLDVLFYTSPHYCQMILDTVCSELNRIYMLFKSRNPDFKGQVSLGGHSLGSVILYDLLCNQPVPRTPARQRPEKAYISGTAANNPTMQYPTLCFEPVALYALGSPIAIFECIRGVESLGSEFCLPTCRNFFNIFHPYDPIAYRIEPLVNPELQNVKPSLIPHHKGRKRMHLELKDTMARVGADLKQKLVESIKNTWTSMWSSAAPPDHQLEKVVEEEMEKEQLEEENLKEEPVQADVPPGDMLGRLNGGRRVDYVLQEAPFEMINEYLFAMSSHVCYWESEDVMLMILREMYDSMGVQPDVTVPQQSMCVQRTTVVTTNEEITVNSTDASTSRT